MNNVKLNKIYTEMFADQDFKDSFIKICEKNKEKTLEKRFDIILKKLVLPYAKKHNYNITENDIESYELLKIQELSEEDLKNIAGGLGPVSILSSIALLVSMPIGIVSNFSPNSATGQVLKKVGEITAVKYVTDKVNEFDKKATTRFVKNAIGDFVGVHSLSEGWQKTRNLFNGKVATPESDENREKRTGLTAPSDLGTIKFRYDKGDNVAVLTSSAAAGGLGCSVDTLMGYIKNQLNDEKRYENLKYIILKGQPDVQLGGTSHIPIIWMDSKENIKSVRIPSSKDKNFNFVYYPETEQMYVAGSGTPTITQEDLNSIKYYGNLPAPISKINMWGWKSFFPGFRQQLNFDEVLKNNWKNINDTFGNYQYFNRKADKEATDFRENLRKYNELWFTDLLQKNPLFIDSNGTLTLNFDKPIDKPTYKAIDLNDNTIKTLLDRCKFLKKDYHPFNNQIRLNFVSSESPVNISNNSITLITSIIQDNNALHDKDKFTKTTVTIKENFNAQAIKDLNPTTLVFNNFKAVKGYFGYIYIEPLDNQTTKNIQISDTELNAIADIFGVSNVYSKVELNCSWARSSTPRYWKYSKN